VKVWFQNRRTKHKRVKSDDDDDEGDTGDISVDDDDSGPTQSFVNGNDVMAEHRVSDTFHACDSS